MSNSRKHHYVPRGYLNFFANSNHQILVVDKNSQKSFRRSIAEVAQEHDYNRVSIDLEWHEDAKNDPIYYEKKYTPLVEETLPQVISSVVAACTLSSQDFCVINTSKKTELARIIITQLLRTPKARLFFDDLSLKPVQDVFKKANYLVERYVPEDKKKEYFERIKLIKEKPDYIKSIVLDLITGTDFLGNLERSINQNHLWVIYENSNYRNLPFIVGDEPVLLINTANASIGFGINALEMPETVICFPLSPRFIACLYHKNNILSSYLKPFENKCTKLEENDKLVFRQNQLQFANCTRQLFIPPETELADSIEKGKHQYR